ncbi:MAG: hypothetical protein A2268_12485 [Candidatus Raymondbacteria bacterium RifOxyA12_full_50_37]|uniref:Secretion system C-terminal sorting domain-containing protein n=1 Tax=Candidatus Raymondbacteria bacterium RIFOXYD12_FULL_49_13 TaxID=1817890 RepID=A0A1F7F0H2_UNCRA|nr:MAG: hypothetical protein A2248_15970 [Candidatus Raymondbacteria bacterium RIFOXYA2_FULL_49_16]OGJ91949.1 MAG: hypothetical protein A2268_12485 [Candidatus Raymondbacteria bacterium RifOxyA12_full_50_37]OGJ98745.1 MAG: hypothetical protein A2487_06915 [Candidatus Raymondbacteria bacterium RifOxyC12_full_50_8]OGK00131.1 MAG: hypothetical protein A2519_22045 [Candidatus Raymondbacteria bacterium RIFOXYD12_FULL_49_13]OGK03996.1 MAG: hypothetical protein A2350_04195 [Candidatus Raymondbacteria 
MNNVLAAACILLVSCFTIFSAVPGNLTALVRSGQTFLSWDEVAGGQKYVIYKKAGVITSTDLTITNKRYEVIQGSANSKYLSGGDTTVKGYRPNSRNIITPLDSDSTGMAPPVPDGKGMIVFTAHENGGFYYAVTAVVGGVEDKSIGAGNMVGPISETVEDPVPVLAWQHRGKCSRVYFIYTDVDSFNPTYLGNYVWPVCVSVRSTYNNNSNKGDLRLYLGGYPGSMAIETTNVYAHINVRHHERGSWNFGYSQTFAFDTSLGPSDTYGSTDPIVTQGPIVNFVQARAMNFFKWMIYKEPYYSERIDTNRIWVTGGSMGGGGTLMFLHNYPDFFAYGKGWVAPTNFLEGGPWTWLRDCEAKWGTPVNDAITMKFTGWRSEWLNQNFAGMTAHAWFNLENMLMVTRKYDLPWIAMAHAGQDGSVNWPTQGQGYYPKLEESRRGWSGGLMGGSDHSCCAQTLAGNTMLDSLRKNISYVAISSLASNPVLPMPDSAESIQYEYNKNVAFSTPFYRVGGYKGQVDEVNRYEIVLAATTYNPYGGPNMGVADDTADITPRRLQNFIVVPGEEYVIRNTAVNDTNTIYQKDTVAADSDGLVTFEGFILKMGSATTGGCRFIMVPLDSNHSSINMTISKKVPVINCSPNPFNPSTVISIKNQAPSGKQVEIQIFDIHGKLVQKLTASPLVLVAGLTWDASFQPSGVYIVRLSIGDRIYSSKITLLR